MLLYYNVHSSIGTHTALSSLCRKPTRNNIDGSHLLNPAAYAPHQRNEHRKPKMEKLRQNAILVVCLIACGAGIWAMISDGPASPGGAALAIGAVGLGFWLAGWFKNAKDSESSVDETDSP